ncbi:unnamed protein product [Aphanomyces euteiches]
MKEGYLQKQGQLLKGWKKRWFVCDGRSLNCYHHKFDKTPTASVSLETATVQDGGTSERWNGPRIYVTDAVSGIVYCLSGDDGAVVLQWLDVLQTAIQRLREKQNVAARITPVMRMKSQSLPLPNDDISRATSSFITQSPRKSTQSPMANATNPPATKRHTGIKHPVKTLATTIRLENELSTATELLNCLLFTTPSAAHPLQFHFNGIHDGVRISTAVNPTTGKLYTRGSMVVDLVPATALRILLDHQRRQEWDMHFPHSAHVASYGGATDLVYLSGGLSSALFDQPTFLVVVPIALLGAVVCGLWAPGLAEAAYGAVLGAILGGLAVLLMSPLDWQWVVRPRDLLLLRHVYEATAPGRMAGSSVAMAIAEWSVANELKPEIPGVVRAAVGVSGWLVQPLGTESTLITHVEELNLQGWIPSYVNTRVAKQRMLCLAAISEYVKHAAVRGPQLGFDDEPEVYEDDITPSNEDDIDEDEPVVDESHVATSILPADAASRTASFHPRDYLRTVVRNPTGGVTLTDKEVAKRQNGVLMEIIKNMGTKLLDGKSAVSLSLPVRIFEPRSMLDRLVDFYMYAPNYLPAANDTSDPVERLKLTMAFAVAGWHHWVGCAKPFNPIVGETLETQFCDGATVHCEQASSNPTPISFAQVEHSKYRIASYTVVNGGMQTNSLVMVFNGNVRVQFTADGGVVEFTLPSVRMSGLLWGERIIELAGTILFQDKANDISCELRLNPDEHKGMFASNKAPTDYFRGSLVAKGDVLCDVSGSWLEEIRFGDKVYWNLDKDSCAPLVRLPDDKVLPSDSRNRPDLRALALNNLEEAQERKYELEKRQRVDRALRKEGRRPNHWTFAHAKLLDDNKANRYHELFQVFDVALVERLRDDGEFVQAIMASLSRNRHARAYAKLLFDNKHILDAKDMAHFHLDFLQRRAEPSKEELQPMSPTEDEIDQTFSVEPRTLAFPLSLDENHKLESLVKQDVPLTNFGAHAISDLIRREDRLERLSLVSCQLGTAGMILLADAIAESKSLRVLDVSNPSWTNSKSHRNYITNSGIKALSLALQTNTSLEKIVLDGNPVGYSGGIAMAQAMYNNRTLRVLHLKQ